MPRTNDLARETDPASGEIDGVPDRSDVAPRVAAMKQAARDHRFNVVQVPALRLLGFVALTVLVFLHNRYIPGMPSWRVVFPFGGTVVLYALLTWLALYFLYERMRQLEIGTVVMTVDLLAFAGAVYVTGGQRSLLFFLPWIGVADQANTSFRRVVMFVHAATAVYAGMLAWISLVDAQPVAWSVEATKVAIMYGIGLYIAMRSRTAERVRAGTSEAVSLGADIIGLRQRESDERRQADQSLRLFRAQLEHANDSIEVIDPETGRFLDMNARGCLDLGYRYEEILALTVSDIDPHVPPAAFHRIMREMRATGSVRLESEHRRKDGTLFPVEVASRLVQLDREYLVVVVRDITERKRAEAETRASDTYRSAILDCALECIITIDHAQRIVDFNPAAERTFGHRRDDVLGRLMPEIIIPPALREAHAHGFARLMATGESRTLNRRLELTGLRADGSEFPLELAITRLPGEPLRFTGFLRDLSERKRTEQLLDWEMSALELIVRATSPPELLDALMLGLEKQLPNALCSVLLMDADGVHLRHGAAPSLPNAFNHSMDGVAIGPQVGSCGTAAYFNRQVVVSDIDTDPLWVDYRVLALEHGLRACWSTPILSGDGKVVGTFAIYYREPHAPAPADLSLIELARNVMGIAIHRINEEAERHKLEGQLRQSQKMEAIGALAGGIAHDFNNILGAIMGNVVLAQQDTEPGHPARASLDQIQTAGERAKGLVQQILAFSRQDAQEKVVLNLCTAIAEDAKLLRTTLPANVELTIDCAEDVPNILANTNDVHRVLLNLCTNAWHAMEGQPGHITIGVDGVSVDTTRAHADLRPGRYARLIIRDTGNGMDASTLERIFDPFFTTKTVGTGTGLGLSVVHGIVKTLQGTITVASQPGMGATFALYFPAAEGERQAESAPTRPAQPQRGQGQNILYLDDEQALVAVGKRLLERRGYHVTGFTRPADAVAALRADPRAFDLVLTDYNMAGASGIDVAREIRTLRPSLPVMLLSGFISDELREEATAAGIRHMLHKPFGDADLGESVHRLLHSE